MKNGTRNIFIGLGIAAGAIITLSAFTGKTRQKLQSLINKKLTSKINANLKEGNEDNYYV